MALGPQRKIFALGMYISCCLCQFGHPTQTRFSVEYGLIEFIRSYINSQVQCTIVAGFKSVESRFLSLIYYDDN